MSLDEYKAKIDRLMHLAALDLTDEEFDALIAWTKEQGWGFLGKKGLYEKDVPKWIYVSEEPPKEFHDVLCYTDAYDMFIATYYGLDGDGEPMFDDNNGDYWEGNVIYWMPLPKPPKEVSE